MKQVVVFNHYYGNELSPIGKNSYPIMRARMDFDKEENPTFYKMYAAVKGTLEPLCIKLPYSPSIEAKRHEMYNRLKMVAENGGAGFVDVGFINLQVHSASHGDVTHFLGYAEDYFFNDMEE